MTNEELIQMAREIGEGIQSTDEFVSFLVAKNAADKDPELQEMLGKFNLKKVDLNRISVSADKDQEKIDSLNAEIKILYESILSHPLMIAYSDARDELDEITGFIIKIIQGSADGQDPYEIEANCGGDCGSCGGCH